MQQVMTRLYSQSLPFSIGYLCRCNVCADGTGVVVGQKIVAWYLLQTASETQCCKWPWFTTQQLSGNVTVPANTSSACILLCARCVWNATVGMSIVRERRSIRYGAIERYLSTACTQRLIWVLSWLFHQG